MILRSFVAVTALALATSLLLASPPTTSTSRATTPTGEQVVWVLGDACLARDTPVDCGDVGDQIVADTQRDALLVVGDAQYVSGTLAEYNRWYDARLGAQRGLKAITYPVPGNHDYETTGARGYFDYFGARAGNRSQGWYTFTLGSWRLVAANSNCGRVGGCTGTTPQGRFVRDALQRSETCELVFAHHPAFSDGPHGDTTFGRDLFRLAYNFHAELYVAGHDHSYQRFARKQPDGVAAPWGVRSFVVGTGGSDLTAWRVPVPRSEFRQNTSFGALRLVLGSSSYSARFVAVDGQVLDTTTGTCRA